MTPATAVSDSAAVALVHRFFASFNRHDVDAIMADMTDDCVFEIVAPPDKGGGRWEGATAVRAVWESLDGLFPGYAFEIEDLFLCGDRGAARWSLTWQLPDGGQGTARGIDVYVLRDGKVAEKIDYFTL